MLNRKPPYDHNRLTPVEQAVERMLVPRRCQWCMYSMTHTKKLVPCDANVDKETIWLVLKGVAVCGEFMPVREEI